MRVEAFHDVPGNFRQHLKLTLPTRFHVFFVLPVAILLCECSTPYPTSPPPSMTPCVESCKWPAFVEPSCAQNPAAREYTLEIAKRLWHSLEPREDFSPSDCVCLTVRLSDTHATSDVAIVRSSSEHATQRVLQAARVAGPFPPVPPDAACLLDRRFNPLRAVVQGE